MEVLVFRGALLGCISSGVGCRAFAAVGISLDFHTPATRWQRSAGIIKLDRKREVTPFRQGVEVKLDVQTQVIDGVTILHCRGRLTYRDEARAFSETIAAVIRGGARIVIEMTDMEAIDSAGLGELAVIHMWARASGCALKLAGAGPRIEKLFELTNLLSIFETYPTLDDALRSFQEQTLQAEAASNAA
jgi:anti-sigma B factor antagonist